MKEASNGKSNIESRTELNKRSSSVGKAVEDFAVTAASSLLSPKVTSVTSPFCEPSVAPEFRSVATDDFSSIVNRGLNRASFGAPFLSTDESFTPQNMSKTRPFDQFKTPIFQYNKEAFVEPPKHLGVAKDSRASTSEQYDRNVVHGWDANAMRIAPLCPYFPMDLVKAELPRSELCKVQTRLEKFFKADSIQAVFVNQPASAKLQTSDGVECRLQFWEARDKDNFYVDVQRCSGDKMLFRKMLNRLIDVVKGIHQETTQMDPPPIKLNKIREFQSIMEFISSLTEEPVAVVADPVELVVEYTYASLCSRCFTERAQGLSYLMSATDLLSTVETVAVPVALVVLQGQARTMANGSRREDFNRKARGIQNTLFGVLANGEYDGDEALKRTLHDKSIESSGSASRKRKQCGRYEDCMGSSIHNVLSILACSLEAIAVGSKFLDGLIVKEFLQRFSEFTGIDIYCTLLDYMENSSAHMAIGYLACKSMRLLASLSPALKIRLQGDVSARETLEKACITGRKCHCLLETESKMLQDLVV